MTTMGANGGQFLNQEPMLLDLLLLSQECTLWVAGAWLILGIVSELCLYFVEEETRHHASAFTNYTGAVSTSSATLLPKRTS